MAQGSNNKTLTIPVRCDQRAIRTGIIDIANRKGPIVLERSRLTDQLRAIGVVSGSILLVHTSFSRVGPVDEGPLGLIDALRGALGPGGTLAMPSMTDDDDRPFDPKSAPCAGMGIVAETFWRMPASTTIASDY